MLSPVAGARRIALIALHWTGTAFSAIRTWGKINPYVYDGGWHRRSKDI